MKIASAWLAFLLAFIACGDDEVLPGPNPPANLPRPYLFEFHTVGAVIDSEPVQLFEDGHFTCTDFRALQVCAVFGDSYVAFELSNESHEPVTVVWSKGRWIDELGTSHLLGHHPGDDRADDRVVAVGQIYRDTPSPAEKTYLVAERENAYYFSEPIIPWDLRSGDPDEKRRVMMEKQQSTFLTVPIAIAGEEHVVAFEFQVFPRQKS